MFDLMKYKGHTPEPWCYGGGQCSLDNVVRDSTGRGIAFVEGSGKIEYTKKEKDANGLLIADAPKLLAEVKRLREEVKEITIARDIVYCENEAMKECIGGHGMEIEVSLISKRNEFEQTAKRLRTELEQAQERIAELERERDVRFELFHSVASDLAQATALLRELEELRLDAFAFQQLCPICENDFYKGHAPDCRLAAFLKEAGNEDVGEYLKEKLIEDVSDDPRNAPMVKATHRHYKGGLYRVLFLADGQDSLHGDPRIEDQMFVVYQAIDGSDPKGEGDPGRVFIRLAKDFNSEVRPGIRRFVALDSDKV